MTGSRVRRALPGLLAAAAAACWRADLGPEASASAPLGIRLLADRQTAQAGDTISLLLRVVARGADPVTGVQGELRFDARRLRFLGQPLAGRALVMVNDRRESEGTLRVLVLDVAGLDSIPVDLRFEVLRPGPPGQVAFRLEEAVLGREGLTDHADIDRGLGSGRSPLAGRPTRRVSAEDWIRHFGDSEYLEPPAVRLPGQGGIYGDANLSQSITVGDVVSVSNVAVGNLPLLTDLGRDFAIAGNVAPANLPGLGEPADPTPPGRNADGSWTITVGDATAIANEAVGNDQPVPGQPIPGRDPTPTARAIVDDSVRADRTFFRDTVYELRGTVIVGSPDVADVTLTIEAGTRIEGDVLTRGRLVIRRGANLVAIGTRLQPIVFSCNAPIPSPGCWGGVTINGFGVLNNGDPLPPGQVGFPTKEGIGGSGTYGGILVEDSSGVMRYVRIEHAGVQPFTASDTLPGLQLLGVGSNTGLDFIQIYQPLGEGIFVSGGTARIRNLVITEAGSSGLRWADGWQGRGQFLLLQQGSDSRAAIVGANFAGDPMVLPRSAPVLAHVTVTGPAPSGTTGQGLLFEHGSAGILMNGVILRAAAVGLEIDGSESCNQTADSLSILSSVFFANATDFSTDADCIDEVAFALDPPRSNRVIDPALLAPFLTASPDLRPGPGSPLLTSFTVPPADGFMDQNASYVGAVEPANVFRSNVPWYAGWTRGF
jgi:hypothetical protein